MNKDLVEITHHQTFESLRQEEDGCEFWSARKLAKALEYNEYRNFLNVIEKAKEAGFKRLYLESNTILKPAINLYYKLGFKKITGAPSPYERSNIQMELILQD